MMDLSDRARDRAQRAAARAPVFEVAAVTAPPAGGRITVDSSGASESVVLAAGVDLTTGDRALIARAGDRAWAVARVAGRSLPPVGVVIGAPPGDYVTVSAGGRSYQLPRLATYAPGVGHRVGILWGGSGEGGLVLGQVAGAGEVAPAPAGADPVTPASPPRPGLAAGSNDFAAIDSGQYLGGSWGTLGNRDVYQGDGGDGVATGAWFYGSTPRDSIGAGATVTACRVRVSRRAGGTDAPLAAHLYQHGSPTRPVSGDVTRAAGPLDVTLTIGESKWVDLPASWGQAILDGNGGVGVSGSPFVALNGIDADPEAGLLHIEWKR